MLWARRYLSNGSEDCSPDQIQESFHLQIRCTPWYQDGHTFAPWTSPAQRMLTQTRGLGLKLQDNNKLFKGTPMYSRTSIRTNCFSAIIVLFLLLYTNAFADDLNLESPQKYTGKENIVDWHMSEKLDGIRAYWDGEKLLTRTGKTIYAPKWFTADFPPFALDGELWAGRTNFNLVQRTVLDQQPSHDWSKISYHIFEVPNAQGDFPTRLQKAQEYFNGHKASHAHIVPQTTCTSHVHLHHFLQDIEKKGGEGVIIKDPEKPYTRGSCSHILKVKKIEKMPGEVIAINPGQGKFEDMMGSLTLRLENGIIFKIGTGFTEEERKNPPDVGAIVTFKYHGWTKNNKPRFASFVEIKQHE